MKKLLTNLAVLFTAAFLLFSCSDEQLSDHIRTAEPVANTKYNMSNIPDGSYVLLHDEIAVYPQNDLLYAGGESGFGYYDILHDMAYTKLSEDISWDICVTENEIVVLTDGAVKFFDKTGLETASYDIAYYGSEESEFSIGKISLSEAYIFLSYTRYGDEKQHIFTIIDRTSGEVSDAVTIDNGGYGIYEISHVSPWKTGEKDTYVLTAKYNKNEIARLGLFRYSVKNNQLEMISSISGVSGCVDYISETQTISLVNMENLRSFRFAEMEIDADTPVYQQQIGMDNYLEQVSAAIGKQAGSIYSFAEIFYTGQDYIVWDKKHAVVSAYGNAASKSDVTLTVLYSEDDPIHSTLYEVDNKGSSISIKISEEMKTFEETEDCVVKSMAYPVSDFSNRLRMKLLAGEKDFDVVYVEEAGEILSAVLQYQLYLPLENYEGITANYDTFLDGVQDVMSYDGHIFGVPFSFVGSAVHVTEEYLSLGLPEISADWTYEDFWSICEAAIPFCGDDTALMPNPMYHLLYSIVEEGVKAGGLDRAGIESFVMNIKKYYDAGVLQNYGEAEHFICTISDVPAQMSYHLKEEPRGYLVNMPLYHDQRYTIVESFVFINRLTEKADLAAKYLEMLTGPDFAPRKYKGKTYFVKDTETYFDMIWGDASTPQYEQNRWNKEIYRMTELEYWLTMESGEVLNGSAPYTVSADGISEVVYDIMKDGLLAGKLTVEEAAEELYSELCYRFLE